MNLTMFYRNWVLQGYFQVEEEGSHTYQVPPRKEVYKPQQLKEELDKLQKKVIIVLFDVDETSGW